MLRWRQVGPPAGVVISLLVASALGLGGYHNRAVAVGLLVFAGICAVVTVASVPTSRAIQRRLGNTTATASHSGPFGHHLHLKLDLGTTPGVGPLDCEVHLPFYGGPALANQIAHPERQTTLMFPDDFKDVPAVYRNHPCGGRYQVKWIATQFATQRGVIATERFRIGPPRPPLWKIASGFAWDWGRHPIRQVQRIRASRTN